MPGAEFSLRTRNEPSIHPTRLFLEPTQRNGSQPDAAPITLNKPTNSNASRFDAHRRQPPPPDGQPPAIRGPRPKVLV